MTINDLIGIDENELPLQNIVSDGGCCGIFRAIGCVGDSLSSGEFEGTGEDGKSTYHDMFDYSWGQYLARMAGCTVRNFSRGGMTGREYCQTFAEANDFWNPAKACQAYILALGVNDLYGLKQDVGTMADICDEDWSKNADTFTGWYAQIIQRLKAIQPDAKFFLMTMPREDHEDENAAKADAHAEQLYRMAEHFSNCYVLDLRKYGPVYDAAFRKKFYLSGHMTPTGYLYTARVVASYIDYIIRHNMTDFKQVGFIGTPWKNTADI
ncbi:MAG: SGNH/GDSL hydrolase family protein [Oscillospiraceae bacterium]|nr:SGNH/GDSL hydrolase family protein [Oscillospiraceae bacterium]